jgi:hypothetical protein
VAPKRECACLGSTRVSRVGERVLAIADFFLRVLVASSEIVREVRFGATPKPARETRALPIRRVRAKLSICAFADSFAGCNDDQNGNALGLYSRHCR